MTLESSSLRTIPTCYASCSIGCKPSHTLPKKLQAIAAAGFTAIELSFPDLLSFACEYLKKDNVGSYDYDDLCKTGEEIKRLCKASGLKILILQPFSNFEGWPQGSEERKDAWVRAKGWIRIMEAVGTDMLQVGSSDSPNIETDVETLVSDLRKLADYLAGHNFRLAYENWCWSTHAPTWASVWEIVKAVDRPNIGLCLDTFQTAGSEWADPTTKSGLIEEKEGVASREELDERLKKSLSDLSATVPASKIYFLQISDAYLPHPLLSPHEEDGLRPRGRWSHDYRPMPFQGGYLPVVAVTKAVLRTGFRGFFSVETFDGGREGKGRVYDDLEAEAARAMEAHRKLLEECAEAGGLR
ncbi:MAG: hypothetical protein M1827_003074 [Pycnora praestabilis]|nr:MAG: hypothetical protein M1827_003074 [Pycnora praestabilis]